MSDKKEGVSRRNFLKIGGGVAVAAQIGAVAGVGLSAGKDPATHIGWQHLDESNQFVDRKPLEINTVPYEVVGPTRRPDMVESAFGRGSLLRQGMMNENRKNMKAAADKANQEAEKETSAKES